eukprot:205447_1
MFLDDFAGGVLKIEHLVSFPKQLDLSIICEKKSDSRYQLKAVVEHLGKMANKGHYVAKCERDLIGWNRQWYKFDDENVFGICTKDAYILCYEKEIVSSIENITFPQ